MLPDSLKKYLTPCDYATNATLLPPKPGLVAKVAKVAAPVFQNGWDYVLGDWPEERAAIMEFDGGLSRAEAERRAGLN